MKLYYSPHSPFVRKVLVFAHEAGLFENIELLANSAGPIQRDAALVAVNPLGQVPTLVLDDNTMLADSRVICEYINSRAGASFYPEGDARFVALTEHAMADGLLNAALLARYETVARPESVKYEPWLEGQMAKMDSVIAYFEAKMPAMANRVDLASITLACGLAYLEHRFPEYGWQAQYPAVAQWYDGFCRRSSMEATRYGIDRMQA